MSSIMILFVLVVNILNCNHAEARSLVSNITLEQKMREDVDLSQFYSLVENNPFANTTLQYRSVTVFAPANVAFQKYTGKIDESLVLYHITNSAQHLNQLGNSLSSEQDGNPPLWITRQRNNNRDDIYINNAKVIQQRSNQFFMNLHGRKQVLHIIDDVLEPLRSPVPNPDAYQFLNQSELLDLDTNHVRSFRQRVMLMNKQDVFRAEGRYTFFIPVDEGFQPPPRPEKIDAKVIDGHIIPRVVLFTNPTPDDKEYETLAFTDMIKVSISFKTETLDNNKATKTYVKSHTIVGDNSHAQGVVLSEIVKANIPVRNGVVHLIHRPLMVIDTTVTQFLESFKDREDGPLYKFYEVIRDYQGEFMDKITRMRDLTLFAPSNAAWKDSNLNNFLHNKQRMRDILDMHLVGERLPLKTIIDNNRNQVSTLTPRKSLYFNVVISGNNKTLTVEGGGVNATVIQPDIAATNGIVHIIDRVLGVPFTTVGRKLATDPMLNKTYQLGKYDNFNDQLDDMRKHFTYFVPRDYAWAKMEAKYPSAHKKIFMRDFGYHVKQILERHLVLADVGYTMADLKRFANESVRLPTLRDTLNLRVKESEKSYYIEWNNEWVHVFRPDVECTNGIIHVIDSVLLRENDIQVTGGAHDLTPLGLWTLFALCLSLITARCL